MVLLTNAIFWSLPKQIYRFYSDITAITEVVYSTLIVMAMSIKGAVSRHADAFQFAPYVADNPQMT